MILIKRSVLFLLLIFLLLNLRAINNYSFAEELSLTPTVTPTIQPTPTPDTANQDKLNQLQNQIKELEGKISDLQGQEKTLYSQIGVMDSQIKLTELRVNATKQEIADLTDDIKTTDKKISNLEVSLNNLTKVLLNRIVATYQTGSSDSLQMLLSSDGIADFLSKISYLKIVQTHDKELILETQQAKNDYSNQKQIFEEKKQKVEALKKQLETYTTQLAQEKKGKQQLLEITKNNEKNYQDMLARTRAEYNAIQGIIAGKGSEVLAREVKEGDGIASIISGVSACSTGTHLHFEVSNNGSNSNPASYLSSKDVNWDLCGWFGCDGPFSFSGSWAWPINGRPIITQGYGMTAYARSGAYGGGPHTGIDIISDDLLVKAVKEGSLYQGSIACGGGQLRYVKVRHKDGGIDSYYLHINYSF